MNGDLYNINIKLLNVILEHGSIDVYTTMVTGIKDSTTIIIQ